MLGNADRIYEMLKPKDEPVIVYTPVNACD